LTGALERPAAARSCAPAAWPRAVLRAARVAALRAWLPTTLLALLFAAVAPPARAQQRVAIPPAAPVVDLTGTLTAEQSAALTGKLRAFKARKGSEISVLLVPTTQPEEIEQYGIRVAEAWRLGRKGVDDGAILLVAKDDRAVRIEVGYGLEGAITDFAASRIIDEYLRPAFRAGDFYGGIDRAVDRLIALVDGEPLPEPPPDQWREKPGGFESVLPILLIALLIAGPILRRLLGRPLGAAATGGVAGFLAWALVGVLGVAIFAGIVAFVFTLLGGLGGNRWSSGGRGGGFGGWGGGGFGGGFGGGGFGGGSWGGGGGFGGGGASGRW
jgi:uncharacterized protein